MDNSIKSKTDTTTPVVKIQFPKSVLADIIKDQDESFHLEIRKAAIHHALEHGCSKFVPTEEKVKEIIQAFVQKSYQDIILTGCIHPRTANQYILSAEAKNMLLDEVRAAWQSGFTEEVSHRVNNALRQATEKLVDHEEFLRSQLQKYVDNCDARIAVLEKQAGAIIEKQVFAGFNKYIEEEVDRRIAARAKLKESVPDATT